MPLSRYLEIFWEKEKKKKFLDFIAYLILGLTILGFVYFVIWALINSWAVRMAFLTLIYSILPATIISWALWRVCGR